MKQILQEMTPLTRKRVLFWLTWTLANGLSVGTFFWFAALVAEGGSPYSRYWGISVLAVLFFGFGSIAGVQQFLLWSLGWPAKWWWLSSFVGLLAAGTAGTIVTDALFWSRYPSVLLMAFSTLVFGVVLGFVQMFGCWRLREQRFAWPAVSGVGILLARSLVLVACLRRRHSVSI